MIELLNQAEKRGRLAIVRVLLQDTRIHPSDPECTALIHASRGHVEIVKLLLQDSRVDPSVQNNQAL